MLVGLINTLHPKRGKGLVESLIFLVLVLGVIYLNVMEIEVNETLNFIINSIIGYLGYMIGANSKKKEGGKSE